MAQRKIPGNLTLSELQTAYGSGFVPNVKIHLQELLPGGKAGHQFKELVHWTSVTVSRAMGGKGRCTISLANVDDRHFDVKGTRIFNPSKAAITKSYLTDLHKRSLGRVKEISPGRLGKNGREFQGIRTFGDVDIKNYVDFLYNFDGWSGGLKTSQAGGKPDLPALGLLQRVIVDAQGPDGKWYALFTGIVSSIEDRFAVNDVPVIELVCSDYWRLFDVSELVIKTGVDPIADSFAFTVLGAQAQAQPQTSSLASLEAKKILHIIMDIVQRTMCWIPYALKTKGKSLPNGMSSGLVDVPNETFPIKVPVPNAPDREFSVSKDDFFNDEPFWYVPLDGDPTPQASYEGHDCLRHYCKALPSFPGVTAKAMQDGDEPFDGMLVSQIYSTLLVDKYIESGIQGTPYAFFIAALLQPWQTTRAVGSSVVRRVAEATFYDISVTPNGDVLYQIPKYNNCPGEYRTKGVLPPTLPTAGAIDSVTNLPLVPPGSTNASFATTDPSNSSSGPVPGPAAPIPISTGGLAYAGDWSDGDYDYAPAPEGFSQRSHGFNHVITDVCVRGWRLSSSEEGLVTTVSVPFGQDLIVLQNALETGLVTGRVGIDFTKALVARFGLRRFEAQKMNVSDIYQKMSNPDFINAFAKALLIQINGRAFGGGLELSFRPDLDVGKNLFLIERQNLFYVVNVSHTVRQGQDASTALQLGYGHDISREIISPFVSVRSVAGSGFSAGSAAQPSSSGSTEAATSSQLQSVPETDPSISSSGPASGPSGPSPANNVAIYRGTSPDQQQPWSRNFFGPKIANLLSRYKSTPANKILLADSTPTVGYGGTNPKTGKPKFLFINVSPQKLLDQAIASGQVYDRNFTMTMKEYTAARVLARETGELSPANLIEMVLVAQVIRGYGNDLFAALTRAGLSIPNFAKPSQGFFSQQAGRQASTFSPPHPTLRTLAVARAVLNGEVPEIIPSLSNFYGLGGGKKEGLKVRTTLFDWTTKGNRVLWVGPIDDINSLSRHIFFRRTLRSDPPTLKQQQLDGLKKLMDDVGIPKDPAQSGVDDT